MYPLVALVALLLGIAAGCFYWAHRIAACQADCARSGMVCSPMLRGGMDYCITMRPGG